MFQRSQIITRSEGINKIVAQSDKIHKDRRLAGAILINITVKKNSMTIGILYREELKEYDFGPGHPFRGDRYIAFYNFLTKNLPANETYKILKAVPATEEDLLLICHRTYIEVTTQYYRAAHLGLTYAGDFFMFHSADNMPVGRPGKIEEAARLVVGQGKKACDLVQAGEFKKVISIGGGLHHAKSSYGEGF